MLEHFDDIVYYLLLIYQNRWKHSKKQLGAGKRKCTTLKAKKSPQAPKQTKKSFNCKGKKGIRELKANWGPNSHSYYFMRKQYEDLAQISKTSTET